jgi:hypothetical protein
MSNSKSLNSAVGMYLIIFFPQSSINITYQNTLWTVRPDCCFRHIKKGIISNSMMLREYNIWGSTSLHKLKAIIQSLPLLQSGLNC